MIRWNAYEIAGLVVLAFSLMALGFWLARWLAEFERHEREEHDSEAAALVVIAPEQPVIFVLL
jgi:uncharacterized membrane protein